MTATVDWILTRYQALKWALPSIILVDPREVGLIIAIFQRGKLRFREAPNHTVGL